MNIKTIFFLNFQSRFKTSTFVKLRNHPFFIDKTNYIKEIIDDEDKFLVTTAAKRFGKTVFLDMMETFLKLELNEAGYPLYQNFEQRKSSKNFQAFLKTKLDPTSSDANFEFFKEHFGQYPVFRVDFSSISGRTYNEILYGILKKIDSSLRWNHAYLRTSNNSCERDAYHQDLNARSMKDVSIVTVLENICSVLQKRFNKRVVLMIDEWDAPLTVALQSSMISEHEFMELHTDLQSLISSVVKHRDEDELIMKTIFTSIVGLAAVSLGDPTSLTYRQFLQEIRYSSLFGFNCNEVLQLLEKSPYKNKINMEDVIQMYDGYTAPDGTSIFNPWSIVHVASLGKLDAYWAFNIDQVRAVELCLVPRLYSIMLVLLNNGTHTIDRILNPSVQHLKYLKNAFDRAGVTSTSIILQFLYENGILSGQLVGDKELLLKIPNLEIHKKLEKKLKLYSEMRNYYKIPLTLRQPLLHNFNNLAILDNITLIDEIVDNTSGNLSMLFQYAVKRTEKE